MNKDQRTLNRQISMIEYNNRAVSLLAKPRILFVELTQNCNLRCPMCRNESDDYETHRMSEELFEKINHILFPFAEIVDLRGWGESMLLDDFPAKAKAVVEAGCELRIMSNLSFCKPRNINALAEANAYVGISLDSANKVSLAKIRTGANLDLIIENVKLLRRIYKENRSDFSRVYISATIQPANVGELCNLVDFARRYGIKQIRLFPAMRDNKCLTRNQDVINLLRSNIEAAFAFAESSSIDLWIGARLWEGMEVDISPFKQPCIHPWTYCFINWRGDVGFCDYLMGPGCEVHLVGNIGDSSFDTIWNGPKMINVRKHHVDGKTNKSKTTWRCEWCYHNRFVDFENIFADWYCLRQVHKKLLR